MKVGIKIDQFQACALVANPDQLVIARVVVSGKIDVVFPEEVVGNKRFFRVMDRDRVPEAERFRGYLENPRREPNDRFAPPFIEILSRLQLNEPAIVGRRFVQPPLEVERVGQPGVRQGRSRREASGSLQER